ncbi:MAG TPA: biotin-dependent carboxyltransferase family protein [Ramlibacter sp.]|nr:biotin-dependent carboxyltransferase family protein [Ramlibacter sp.]
MMSNLKVLTPGIHTTVQDLGRPGFQNVGVPVSGPLDRIGLRLANALVGNAPGTPAFEMILQGCGFEVQADAVRVALAGCDGALDVGGSNARTVAAGASVRLVRGDTVRVANLGASACGYLAIEGGVAVTPELGSASTYVRARMGGINGSPLKAGGSVPLLLGSAPLRPEKMLAQPFDLALDQPIRVALGPQADFFDEAAIAAFLSNEYRVSAQSDRMGFRLDGAPIAHARGYNIVSDGIVTGSIQVPGSGLPIVLMADAQTTGGYPKIATVISADIPALARRRPGSAVRFAAVSVVEAQAIRRAQEAGLRQSLGALRVAGTHACIDIGALYTENLVSGVASANA